MRLRLRSAIALVLTAACAGGAPPEGAPGTPAKDAPADSPADSPAPASPATGRVHLERLRAEPYSFTYASGYETPARIVVGDAAAFRDAWTRLHGSQSPVPAPPAIDFATEQVVIVALGQRATGGYGILVDSAVAGRDSLVVHVTTVAPGPRCGTTAALSEPADVARMARVALPATFRERATVTECP